MTRAAVLAAGIALLLGAAIRHAAQRPCPEPYVEDEDGVQPDPYLAQIMALHVQSNVEADLLAMRRGLGDSEPWGPA